MTINFFNRGEWTGSLQTKEEDLSVVKIIAAENLEDYFADSYKIELT